MAETNTHIISIVLLKKFGDKHKQIVVSDKDKGITYLERVKDIAFAEHTKLIEEAERKWHQTETHVISAYKKLREGKLLESPFHTDVIKNLIAVHYVRCFPFYAIKHRFEEEMFHKINLNVIKKLGRPLTIEEKEWGAGEWLQKVEETTPKIFISTFEKVFDLVSRTGLEVGVAPDGAEFLIGDTPVVTIGEKGKMGIMQGVTIDIASGVGMPLSPQHMVALKKDAKETRYTTLNVRQVNAANEKQVRQALRFYCYKPAGINDKTNVSSNVALIIDFFVSLIFYILTVFIIQSATRSVFRPSLSPV